MNSLTVKAMYPQSRFQINAYYLLTIVVLSVFAFRNATAVVAEYQLVLLLVLPFLLAMLARRPVENLLVSRRHAIDQPKYQLLVDFCLFTAVSSFILTAMLYLSLPTFLIINSTVWVIIVGYFASVDSALYRGRYPCENDAEDYHAKHSSSLTQKLNLFLSITVLITALSISVSAYTYMSLDEISKSNLNEARQDFIFDTLFILGIIITLTTRVIFSYSMNLQNLFSHQMDVLKNVEKGDFSKTVPVLTRDEFSVIAGQTNRIISELREKDKLHKTLERIVSPNIMQKLLEGNDNILKQGEEYDIAILFCDLRKFTTYAEQAPLEEVLLFLNAYFSKITDVVAEHNGIVNKFMGDAILAIFGVDGDPNYVEQAVITAFDILMHSSSARMRDGTKIDIGIGIHKGRTAAGTIGSSDRFEYMFIGDSVNTASRLDGLTKRLKHKIIISSDVYDNLSGELQQKFVDLGEQEIRGKNHPVQVYGADPAEEDVKETEGGDSLNQLTSQLLCRI